MNLTSPVEVAFSKRRLATVLEVIDANIVWI